MTARLRAAWFLMLSIAVAAAPGPTMAQPGRQVAASETARKWLDLAYAENSPAQKLDIYLPEKGDGPFPVIVAIHGGAFKFGDKRGGGIRPLLSGLQRGYAVASINYRLSGEAQWPAQIHDVKAAIRWLRANAAEHQLDPKRMATWGSSAGGYLSALAGVSGEVAKLEGDQGNAEQSSRVQAVVDWFGPINFLTMDPQFAASGIDGQKHSTPGSFESQLLGKPITQAPELVAEANPETYISQDDPPMLIQHGAVDAVIPRQQSIEFARRLEEVLGREKVVIEILEDAGHGGPKFVTPKNVAKALDFLDEHLKR